MSTATSVLEQVAGVLEAPQKLDRSFGEFPDHCSLKATIYRTLFLSKLESFAGAFMHTT
jgi:hypothetical protein